LSKKGFKLKQNIKKRVFLRKIAKQGIKYKITDRVDIPDHRKLNKLIEQHGGKVHSLNSLSHFIVCNCPSDMKITKDKDGSNIYERV